MDTDTIIRQLEYEADKHKNDRLFTGQTDITDLCKDLIPKMKELKRYEDLEQDGRLLELPCKVGDTAYRIVDDCDYPSDCHTKRMCKKCEYRNISIEEETVSLEDIIRLRDEFGETIFFSEEAAEAALKEMEGRA